MSRVVGVVPTPAPHSDMRVLLRRTSLFSLLRRRRLETALLERVGHSLTTGLRRVAGVAVATCRSGMAAHRRIISHGDVLVVTAGELDGSLELVVVFVGERTTLVSLGLLFLAGELEGPREVGVICRELDRSVVGVVAPERVSDGAAQVVVFVLLDDASFFLRPRRRRVQEDGSEDGAHQSGGGATVLVFAAEGVDAGLDFLLCVGGRREEAALDVADAPLHARARDHEHEAPAARGHAARRAEALPLGRPAEREGVVLTLRRRRRLRHGLARLGVGVGAGGVVVEEAGVVGAPGDGALAEDGGLDADDVLCVVVDRHDGDDAVALDDEAAHGLRQSDPAARPRPRHVDGRGQRGVQSEARRHSGLALLLDDEGPAGAEAQGEGLLGGGRRSGGVLAQRIAKDGDALSPGEAAAAHELDAADLGAVEARGQRAAGVGVRDDDADVAALVGLFTVLARLRAAGRRLNRADRQLHRRL
mmetsp:Transcript_26009/g.80043  ORF Transcript_26009/g.80043 Transcript_26009/m.80043 type:complete len:476 (-) Transcript_26009:1190-2617(-)